MNTLYIDHVTNESKSTEHYSFRSQVVYKLAYIDRRCTVRIYSQIILREFSAPRKGEICKWSSVWFGWLRLFNPILKANAELVKQFCLIFYFFLYFFAARRWSKESMQLPVLVSILSEKCWKRDDEKWNILKYSSIFMINADTHHHRHHQLAITINGVHNLQCNFWSVAVCAQTR